MSPNDFHLLSTTRRDPRFSQLAWNTSANSGAPSPYLLLSYHCDRLLSAAKVHGWPSPNDLTVHALGELCDTALRDVGNEDPESCYRIRILLSHAGALTVTAAPAASLAIPDPMVASLWLPSSSAQDPPSYGSQLLEIYPDTVPTAPSLFTSTKTTHRDHYNAARDRFNLPALPTSSLLEVVLYNPEGDITETSIRNIAFMRRSPPCWVTPAASTGCLTGVVRRWLLEQGRIVEADIGELKMDGIVDGEYVLTFNGVEGCRLGKIHFQTKEEQEREFIHD